MSIIVAIDCQDCVMLAATGPSPRATAGPSGSVERMIGLRAIAQQAVLGFTGPEEMGREATAALERYLTERDPRELTLEAHGAEIQAVLSQPVRLAAAMKRALEGAAPEAVGQEEGLIGAEMLIALPSKSRHALYTVNEESSVTPVAGWSYAAIGDRKDAAESFLRFLQRLLWREGKPTRAAGQFAAYWTARHVTDVEGGSSRSVQVVRLSRGTGRTADIVWYGERVMASLRRAVDAGIDEIRSELRHRVVVGFENLEEEPASAAAPPVRRRVPEVRVTLQPPEGEERKPKW